MRQDDRALEMTRQQHQTQYMMRTRFKRTGATSFVGHLDLMKIFERAARRAGLPLLYSQGYNPRPMLVFALPLSVGTDTTGDYVDIAMSVPVDPEEFTEKMAPELPEGLEIMSARSIGEPKKSIMSLVTAASYAFDAKDITRAALEVWKMESVEVEKKAKGGKIRTADIKPLMIKILETSTPDHLEMLVYAGSEKNLRPDVFLKALTVHASYPEDEASECAVTRTELYTGEYPDIVAIDVFEEIM